MVDARTKSAVVFGNDFDILAFPLGQYRRFLPRSSSGRTVAGLARTDGGEVGSRPNEILDGSSLGLALELIKGSQTNERSESTERSKAFIAVSWL